MSKKLLQKYFFLFLTMAGLAFQSTAQTNRQLSLEDAVAYALEHNKTLQNAHLSMDESQAQLMETIAQGLPQVNASIDYSNFFGSTASLGPGFDIEFTPTSNLGISVSQLIFNGNYIVGIQMSKLYREMVKTNAEKTELELIANVKRAYFLGLVTLKSREFLEANVENMDDLLQKTKALVSVGIAEQVDYDQLSVQYIMLKDVKSAMDRQVEMSLNMLRMHMGLSGDVEIELTDSFESIMSISDIGTSLTKNFDLSQNIDYQIMALQTQMGEKQVSMERASNLPTLTGFYSFTEKLLKPEFDLTPPHVIGLNLSIPIFSSGARYAKLKQAQINLDITRNQADLVAQQLNIQEKQLRFNMKNALEQYESQKANLEVARRVFENINNKFRQGTISSLDLTTANNNFLQAESSYISAVFQLLESQLELDMLISNYQTR
ncbi:MAG: TolC family protein [Bacteroidetes bacterium]|nr:MAG: TolC family protein [Bacteroidota bacterium]